MKSEISPRDTCPLGNSTSAQARETVQPKKTITKHGLSVQLNSNLSYSYTGITTTATIFDLA